jgi:hypothetical protein
VSRNAFVVSGFRLRVKLRRTAVALAEAVSRTVIIAGFAFSAAAVSVAAQNGATARAVADQKQSRYQIGVMERVLEGAVEHGATVTRDRLQALLPAQMLLSENARVRGFRLDGYGVFFDVEVPSLEGTLPWSFRTLEQNDLGLQSALKALQTHIEAAGDLDLQQALKRIELQVGPMTTVMRTSAPAVAGARAATGSGAAVLPGADAAQQPNDQILNNPEEAYRGEVKQALMDAMLDHSAPLAIGPDEWLTIAARRNEDRSRLAPADSDAQTIVIRANGADLATFRAGRMSREDAIKRIEVRVF